jgi:hypothetical protein
MENQHTIAIGIIALFQYLLGEGRSAGCSGGFVTSLQLPSITRRAFLAGWKRAWKVIENMGDIMLAISTQLIFVRP